jgi:hypothetical protein
MPYAGRPFLSSTAPDLSAESRIIVDDSDPPAVFRRTCGRSHTGRAGAHDNDIEHIVHWVRMSIPGAQFI